MEITPQTPCLVTGASSGIGREIALRLARRKCRVAILARTEEALEELAREMEAAGGEALVTPADVSDEDAVARAVGKAVETFGSLKLVVANAGLGRYSLVEDQPGEHVETCIRINYEGVARTVRLALPHLLESTPSHLVAVSSAAGLIPHRLGSAYCASKAAVNAYLATLRLEVFDRGVGVSWICPGAVDTPFTDKADFDPDVELPLLARWLVRHLTVEEVAERTLRAVEKNEREVVMPFMMRFFAWTRRQTPGFADWLNRKTG